ncbi:MAG: DUF1015 domain-containing protein, partial [Candidatus Omnitrophica bacterium]|nr:DUF1015 domain-containing protein [Candidatus Omnitrophota bacterium]
MPGIKPFQAYYYNKDKVKDFSLVVSPPYDVISDDRQNDLHNLSPYNFTHIDLAKGQPDDTPKNNKYTRAKTTFEKWIADQVMVQDDGPAIYFYKQEFKILGERHSRLGFIALLELPGEDDSRVFPHENTHQDAVDDRFELTKSLKATLSSIFVCYADQQRKVEKIFNKHVLSNEPLVDVVDENDVRNKVWSFKDQALINEIHDSLV